MKITQKNIGEILQKIYDSEIHLRIGWLWDGGLDYSIGSTSNDIWNPKFNKEKVLHTFHTDIVKGMEEIVNHILEEYPNSSFAEWYIK